MNDSILRLEQKNLQLENSFSNKVGFKVGMRYNYYDLVKNTDDRNFISVGLGFNIPLPMNNKNKKILSAAQIKAYEYGKRNSESNLKFELLNLFYDFRFNLKQYYSKYEELKNFKELIRVERIKDDLNDAEFNPMKGFDLLDQALSAQISLLDLQQTMYLQLVHLKEKTREKNVLNLIRPLNQEEIKEDVKNELTVYAWSGTIQKYPESSILAYLKSWKVSRMVVSLKKDPAYRLTLNYLLQALDDNSIEAEVMFSDNDWIKNPSQVDMAEALKDVSTSKISAVHLDLEPHQFSDWEAKKEHYLDNYVQVVARAKSYCKANQLELNVSIPVFYPEKYLRDIYKHADHVYVMAYGHKEVDYIERKTKEENEISRVKTIIALSGKNFTTLTELHKFIGSVSQKMDAQKFAVHDFENMVVLDRNSNTTNNTPPGKK